MLEQLQAEQVYCVYCGGVTLGTTVDHMPPRTIFARKHRPKGLEFLACAPCNSGSRKDELVASMLSRSYPDPETAADIEEVAEIMRSVANNQPELLQELNPSRRQERRFETERPLLGILAAEAGGVFNANGPLLTSAMQRFGAKLGLALHRHATGRTVPLEGGVAVRWYSNYNVLNGTFPYYIHEMLGEEMTLKQGRFSVEAQFVYASSVPSDSTALTAHLATFRESFATLAFVAENRARLKTMPESSMFRPGFLKDPKVEGRVWRTSTTTWSI